jgi:SET domain
MILQLSTYLLFVIGSSIRQCYDTSTACRISPMSVTTVGRSKYETLLEWLRSHDAVVNDKLVIGESSLCGGCGVFVSSPVQEGEILFTVPRSACVTLADALQDPACGNTFEKLIEKAGPGGNTVVMAAYLAKEYLISYEKENVKFQPYLETLPWERGVNSQEHILFWAESEVETYLKGSFCCQEATDLRSEVSIAIQIIDKIVGTSIRIARGEETEGGFRWPWQITPPAAVSSGKPVEGLDPAVRGAFVTLLTRAFQDGDEDEEKLVPLLDMLQHSEQPNVRHAMRKEDGTVEVRARRNILGGEELLNQYRSEEEESMPYHRFFTRFGFVPGISEPIADLLSDQSSIFYPKVVEV